MQKKQEAVQELFDGFLNIFGDTPTNRVTIENNIKEMVRSKSKITVQDIDLLEKKILTVVTPTKSKCSEGSLKRGIKDEIFPHFQSKTPKIMKSNRSNIRDKVNIHNSSASPISSEFSLRGNFLSKLKLKHQNDEWGKIIKNDSLKFQREQEKIKIQAKLQQKSYFNDLFKQSCLSQHRNNMTKMEQEAYEREFVSKVYSEIESKMRLTQEQRLMQTIKQKNEMIDHIENKKRQKSTIKQIKSSEKQVVNNEILKFYEEENKNKLTKVKKTKGVASENYTSLSQLKTVKENERLKELAKDKEHLDTNSKTLNESEIKYQQLIINKRERAHNLERLEKLLIVKPKKLQDLMKEAEKQEAERLEALKNEEKLNEQRKKEKNLKSKKEIAEALEKQISHKKLLTEIDKSLEIEQGLKNKITDKKSLIEDQEKKLRKKKFQARLQRFYTDQIEAKLSQELSSLQLSSIEKTLNKKLFEESL